jgi:hypothetical protein
MRFELRATSSCLFESYIGQLFWFGPGVLLDDVMVCLQVTHERVREMAYRYT